MAKALSPNSRGFLGIVIGLIAGLGGGLVLDFSLAHAGSIVFLLAYAAPVPLFIAGMGAGAVSAAIAAVTGSAYILLHLGTGQAAYYLLAYALPAAGLSALATRRRVKPDGGEDWMPEGRLLTAFVSYAGVLFIGVLIATSAHDGGLLALTRDGFKGLNAQVAKALADSGQSITPEMTAKLDQYFDLCARLAPALAMLTWMISTAAAMGVAQFIVRQQEWNLRPGFDFKNVQTPVWIVFALAASGLASFFAPAPYDYAGLNLAIAFGLPFFIVGLAVVHAWAAHRRRPRAVLTVFYILVSLVIYLAILVALLGALDQWIDFRKRFAERKLPN